MQGERQPAVAGMFYEHDARNLSVRLDGLFSGLKPVKPCRVVISPHAGYEYSGRTAAHAIAALKPAKRFFVIGPNHTGSGQEFSVMSSGSWRTPLGSCPVDAGLASALRECRFVSEDSRAHAREHSIEVQLPLLQHRFRSFSFAPLCIMGMDYSMSLLGKCEDIGKAVAAAAKSEGAGVIASSDFSHYLPREIAAGKDSAAIRQIMKMSGAGLFRELEKTEGSVCGFAAIAVAISAAKELGLRPELLHSSSSGDVTGDYRSAVTYHAIGFR